MLLVLAWGAGTLLAWHGGLFVGAGSLMLGGFISDPGSSGLWAVIRWYTFLWGPWFVLGGSCSRRRVGLTCGACPTGVSGWPSACSVF
jgi:hypothetical protein